MNILIKLFFIFAKLSLFSFGGGFVMIPAAVRELEANNMATAVQMADTIALASMSPGPVGVNLSVGLGYRVAGFPGFLAAFAGITLLTTILVILVALFLFRIYKHPLVTNAFYGLRPVITGVIIYAAASLALRNNIIFAVPEKLIKTGHYFSYSGHNILELKSIIIAACSFFLLLKIKVPPVFVIILSGIAGVLLF